MGILKVKTKVHYDHDYLLSAITYIMGSHMVSNCYGGVNVNPTFAYEQMMSVKQYYRKLSGNPLVHFMVCFSNDVVYSLDALRLCYRIASYFQSRYQVVFAVHAKPHKNAHGKLYFSYHAHFIMNSVSFVDGLKYADHRSDTQNFVRHLKSVTGDRNWKVLYEYNG